MVIILLDWFDKYCVFLYVSTTCHMWSVMYFVISNVLLVSFRWVNYATRPLVRYGCIFPDSKVHGANMGPIWGRQDPCGPHVGPMNFAIWFIWLWKTYTTQPFDHWRLQWAYAMVWVVRYGLSGLKIMLKPISQSIDQPIIQWIN